MSELAVSGALVTDAGKVRNLNEDSIFFVASQTGSAGEDLGALAVVADGMGGHFAGDVASSMATQCIRSNYFGSTDISPSEALKKAFSSANNLILEHANNHPECAGMGTTCTAIAIKDDVMWLAHIGDSRAYLCRNKRLEKISDDQTLQAKMLREGLITQAEIEQGMHAHVILQALGTRQDIEPTIPDEGISLAEGDQIIICSDGLTDLIDDDEIEEIVVSNNYQKACQSLLEQALARGGHDNISIGVLLIEKKEKQKTHSQLDTKKITLMPEFSEVGSKI